MKIILLILCIALCTVIYVNVSWAQSFDDIDKVFKPFEFEYSHRGTFNMSYCSQEMINCWEFMRPGAVCSSYFIMESVCSAMRKYCHDVYGDLAEYGYYNFELADNYCDNNWYYMYYTRRDNRKFMRGSKNKYTNATVRQIAINQESRRK